MVDKVTISFRETGFLKIDIPEMHHISSVRAGIVNYLAVRYSLLTCDPDHFLDKFHIDASIQDDAAANDMILDLINGISTQYDFSSLIYESISPYIDQLIGPDVMAQKNNNIVYQFPGSNRISELHADYPTNSEFEVVAWVPLVNCYGSKSFYLVPLSDSVDLAYRYIDKQYASWDEFKAVCLGKAIHVEVNYSQCILFWTGLIHGSLVNETSESRWCLNARFKNLFAPCGQHDPLTYYKPLRYSDLTRIALTST